MVEPAKCDAVGILKCLGTALELMGIINTFKGGGMQNLKSINLISINSLNNALYDLYI